MRHPYRANQLDQFQWCADLPCLQRLSELLARTTGADFDTQRAGKPAQQLFSPLEFTASYSYSSADMTAPLNEDFNGLESRLRLRQYTITGPANANQVSDVANVNATIHLTKHVRLIEAQFLGLPHSGEFRFHRNGLDYSRRGNLRSSYLQLADSSLWHNPDGYWNPVLHVLQPELEKKSN